MSPDLDHSGIGPESCRARTSESAFATIAGSGDRRGRWLCSVLLGLFAGRAAADGQENEAAQETQVEGRSARSRSSRTRPNSRPSSPTPGGSTGN